MKIIYVSIILVSAAFSWSLIEAQLFRLKKITLESNKIQGRLNIVFIADIHFGRFNNTGRLEKVVRKINELNADIILLGGDYLDFGKKSKFSKTIIDRLFSDLFGLDSKYGAFAVLGNHDYYLGKDLEYMLAKMKQNNITILKNQTYKFHIREDNVLLHGVDDLQEGAIDTSRLKVDPSKLNIVFTHNPDFYEEYELDFDLGLSGHTHGGQVNLFGLYAPSTESKYGQKYIKRINKKGNATIITTKGLGCISIPVRFCAMPEIIQVQIN